MKDEQFTQLVKKTRRKQLGRTVLVSVGVTFLLVLIGVGSWMWWFNYGPFQGEQMAGLPDGRIELVDKKQNEALSLLLPVNYSYRFNTESKGVSLYFDYYESDKLIEHKEILALKREKSEPFNGEINWGLVNGMDDANLPQKMLFNVKEIAGDGTENMAEEFDFKSYQQKKELGSIATYNQFLQQTQDKLLTKNQEKVNYGQKLVFLAMSTGEGEGRRMKISNEPENLKDNAQTFLFYLKFEK